MAGPAVAHKAAPAAGLTALHAKAVSDAWDAWGFPAPSRRSYFACASGTRAHSSLPGVCGRAVQRALMNRPAVSPPARRTCAPLTAGRVRRVTAARAPWRWPAGARHRAARSAARPTGGPAAPVLRVRTCKACEGVRLGHYCGRSWCAP